MKVLGKIGWLELAYQQEKESDRDGSTYWSERYNIFIESGDDVHMCDSGFLHCQGKDGGRAILARRGIVEGAIGEALIHCSFRDYQGKKYRDIELKEFKNLSQQKPATEPQSPQADKPAAGGATEQPKEEKPAESTQVPAEPEPQPEEGKTSDLPF